MLQALASLAPVFKQGCSEVQVGADYNNPPRDNEGICNARTYVPVGRKTAHCTHEQIVIQTISVSCAGELRLTCRSSFFSSLACT